MKTVSRLAVYSIAGLMLVSVVWAGKFWQDKPFEKWTAKQCNSLLNKSPWAVPFAVAGSNYSPSLSRGRRNPAGTVPDSQIYLQIRFLAARSIKAAIGRMRLLTYPDQPSLKQEVNQFLNQPDPDVIVVEITFYSEPKGSPLLREVDAFFRLSTLETLKDRVFLSHSDSDTKVMLSGYSGPGQNQPGALMYFPRNDENGEPFFDGSEKSILLYIESEFSRIEQKFQPKKMFFLDSFTI